jgi:transposase
MRCGVTFCVSATDVERLRALVGDRNAPQKQVWRARIVLLTAEGLGTNAIMRETSKSKTCVWRWQERFAAEGFEGLLHDKTRPSRIPKLDTAVAERVVALTMERPLSEATHWTGAAMAQATGVSVSSVQRIWRAHGLQPHRVRQFKLSNDPAFVDKLRDVVGLYLDPPAHAVVLSVDEKSQIQALDRTQPGLPMKKGRAGTMTHDYKRHGTTTLFAAMNILDGTVMGRNMQRHRHQEFIRFLNAIEREVPAGKMVHAILDNYAAHKHPEVREMAGAPSALDFPFHPDLRLVAQRRRGVLRHLKQAPAQAWRLPFGRRSSGRHQPLPRRPQPSIQTLPMGRRSQQNHRRRQTRASNVRFDPLARATRLSR